MFIIQLLVDIRLNQRKPSARIDPLLGSYKRLKASNCELVKKLAEEKYNEVNRYFGELEQGRVTVVNDNDGFELTRFLYCDAPDITEIHATSFGELEEWEETKSWWAKNYIDIQKTAIGRGKRLYRTFILEGDEQSDEAKANVLKRQADLKIVIRTAQRHQISAQDFKEANNCVIFFDRDGVPRYCSQAVHEGGEFSRAMIHSDRDSMRPIVDAYKRINAVATSFLPIGGDKTDGMPNKS
jgi:hypothetical protein